MSRLTLLLGSNLGDRRGYLGAARVQIELLVGVVLASSGVRATEPWGYESCNEYLNEVLVVGTSISDPLALLDLLLSIERGLGRERQDGVRYSDRTIDIDILYIDDLVIDHPRLTVPHPRIAQRPFVGELLELTK